MADILIACDEADVTLGTFFLACKKHILDFFESQRITVSELNSRQLNDLAITMHIGHLPKFIFGAYSHGANDSLLKDSSTEFVSIKKNGIAFNGGFVYTFSCSSGKDLGRDLILNKCQCFIGYEKTIHIWTNYYNPFIECANHGLIGFFNGLDTAQAFDSMIQKYNDEIDKMQKINPLVAASLVDNRRALIMHGKNVSLSEFS